MQIQPVSLGNTVLPQKAIRQTSFTGVTTNPITNFSLNQNQIVSITAEHNGLGLDEAKQGGAGNVADELAASMIKHQHHDTRSFMPFWQYNNPDGGFKFLYVPKGTALEDTMSMTSFVTGKYGEDLQAVSKRLHIPEDELKYVIQSKPVNGKSKYCIIEPTSVNSYVTRPSIDKFGEMEKIPYKLFKISKENPSYNKIKDGDNYFLYTRSLAKTAKPYSYDCWGNGSFDAEILNSDEMRALADCIHNKMNTAEFNYFNPASVILHDRPAHTYVNHLANQSANGNAIINDVEVHLIEHNPSRDYQGHTDDPFKFFSMVADEKDMERLKKSPYYNIVEKARKFGLNSNEITPKEREIAVEVMDSFLKNFKDGAGTYNVIKVGIAAALKNPNNTTLGTVSYNYGKEMRSLDTPDVAKFLTSDFQKVPVNDILNGSTPANLKLDDSEANFGRGANGLTKNKKGFKTFKYENGNITEIIEKRENNAKWLTGLIDKAYKKGGNALKELFFNSTQINDGHEVIGHLSKAKNGDILIMGWGRPDPQKGFNMTFDGFMHFLKRTDVPDELKLKTKLLVGAGPWDKNASDFKSIQKFFEELNTYQGGKYSGNAMYVNGFFPNRLVGCAQYGIFTSRYEMCGITPLECKVAGVPYGATATGGPVDYTNDTNGFLTKDPVQLSPKRLGLKDNCTAEELEKARAEHQIPQISDIYKRMIEEYTNSKESYIEKCKNNIEEKIDWHEKRPINPGGLSSNELYENILKISEKNRQHNQKPLNKLTEAFSDCKNIVEEQLPKVKNKYIKPVIITIGAAAILCSGYYYLKNKNNKNKHLNKVA